MSADGAPLSNAPGPFPVDLPDPGTSSLWDRISTWASEHKGVVYTIAGLTLVVGAGGVIYYLSDSNKDAPAPGTTASSKRKNKRDRKKAKERAEKEAATKEESKAAGMSARERSRFAGFADDGTEPKKASVAAAAEDELPEVDESIVATLSEEV